MATVIRPSIQLRGGDPHTINGRASLTSWRERLIGSWLLAALWLCSWTWAPTREIWDAIDLVFFRTTNDWIASSAIWRTICAVANARAFDVVACAATVCLLAAATSKTRRSWRREFISISLLIVAVLGSKFVVADLVLTNWCNYQRESPTLACQSVRISQLEPWVNPKDCSAYCFPSDHGLVVLAVAFYVVVRSPRYALWAFFYVTLFAMPRVMSGAHWLTDILVGSSFVAFAGVSLLMMTPLHQTTLDRLDPAPRGT